MNRQALSLALWLLILTPLAAWAQGEQPVVAVAGPQSIYLYWGPNGGSPHLYQVYRQAGGGSFVKLAQAAPVRDFATVQQIYEGAADPLSRQMTPHPDLHQRADERPQLDADFSLISTAHARVRGYAFLDTTAKPGVTYRYRVTKLDAQNAETPVGEAEVVAGSPVRAAAPHVSGAVQAGAPVLTWAGPAFTSFEVHRAPQRGAAFEKLTVIPVPGSRRGGEFSFRDTTAVNDGRTYLYRVVPLDLLGQAGTDSQPVSVATADLTAPEPPGQLTTAAFPGGIRLSWNAQNGGDTAAVHVYRSELLEAGKANRPAQPGERQRLTASPLASSATTFDDTSAMPGKVYHYEMTAIDAHGNESRFSPPVLASPKDSAPPRAPVGLEAAARETGKIILTWASNSEQDLFAYRIYRGVGKDGALVFAREVQAGSGPGRITHTVQLDARAQDVFRFAVTAVDLTDNESSKSGEASVRFPDGVPPLAPVITGVQAGNGLITLTWAAASEPDLQGFWVYRTADAGAPPSRLNSEPLPVTEVQYQDEPPAAGIPYWYVVSAVDASGNESAPSASVSSFAFKSSTPGAPTDVRTQKTEKGMKVSWNGPAQANFAGFVVFRSEQRDGKYEPVSRLMRDATFLDTTASPAKAYWYRVVSFSKSGRASEPSAASAAVAQGN